MRSPVFPCLHIDVSRRQLFLHTGESNHCDLLGSYGSRSCEKVRFFIKASLTSWNLDQMCVSACKHSERPLSIPSSYLLLRTSRKNSFESIELAIRSWRHQKASSRGQEKASYASSTCRLLPYQVLQGNSRCLCRHYHLREVLMVNGRDSKRQTQFQRLSRAY